MVCGSEMGNGVVTSLHFMPDIRVEPLELADLDAAWQISLRAFANDAHTLFKMHEKGSTDAGSELLPKDAMESYIRNPAKKRLRKAVIDDRMVGFTIWGMYNWEGQNREVSALLVLTDTLGSTRLSRREHDRSCHTWFSSPRTLHSGHVSHRAFECHHLGTHVCNAGQSLPTLRADIVLFRDPRRSRDAERRSRYNIGSGSCDVCSNERCGYVGPSQ